MCWGRDYNNEGEKLNDKTGLAYMDLTAHQKGRYLLNYHMQLCISHSVLTPGGWSLPPQLPSAFGYLCMLSPLPGTCLTWLSPWLPPPLHPAVRRYRLCRETSGNHTWNSPGSPSLRCSPAAWPSFIFLHPWRLSPSKVLLMHTLARCLFPSLSVRSTKAGALSLLLASMNNACLAWSNLLRKLVEWNSEWMNEFYSDSHLGKRPWRIYMNTC